MSEIVISPSPSNKLVIQDAGAEVVLEVPVAPSLTLSAPGPQGPAGLGLEGGGNPDDLLVRTASGTTWTSEPIVDAVNFDTTISGVPNTIGKIVWDGNSNTPVVRHNAGTIGRLGQDQHCLCKNSSSVSLIKGRVVMFTGVDQDSKRIEIGPLLANGQYPSYVYFGVTAEAIDIGEFGMVCTFGYVENIDTSIYPDDSVLWACTVNPGAMVLENQLQPAPALSIPTAVVVKSHPTEGIIFVRASTGAELRLLHDVYTDLALDGDVLTWIDNLQRWESKAPANASAPRNVTITYPQVGDSFTLFRASRDLTVSSIVALVSSGSVTYTLRSAADRTDTGTLISASSTVTSTTTGDSATPQNQPVLEGDWVWVEITGVTGEPVEFSLSVAF